MFVPSLPWQNDRFYTIKTAPKRRFSHHIACEALSGSPLGPFTRHRPTRLPFLRITGDIFESCSVQSHRHPHRSQQQSKAHGQLQSKTAGGFAAQCTSASVHVMLCCVRSHVRSHVRNSQNTVCHAGARGRCIVRRTGHIVQRR